MDGIPDEFHAYLNKATGEFVTVSDEDFAAIEDGTDLSEYPEWQRESIETAQKVSESDVYLELPNKFEINEYEIMERFCYSIEDPNLSDELVDQIRGSGAFRRFKNAINRHGIEDEWYRYRKQALEEIAIGWLESKEIVYTKEVNSGQ
jgi:hypothetical protein